MGTDSCSGDLLPAKVMDGSELDSKSNVIVLDPGRRVIASAWSKFGFHTFVRNKCYEKGGINLERRRLISGIYSSTTMNSRCS
jgi:hypothetical protein